MALEAFMQGLAEVLTVQTLLFILGGIIVGIFVGSLPGIGPSIGMVLVLPFTLLFDSVNGIIFLIAIFNGAMYGSSIPAILLNAPGAAGSAATTFDGYELSKQGNSLTALSVSAVSSSIGGLISGLVLLLLTPVLVPVVLLFGSPEYFLVALLGLVLISIVSRGSMLKGILSGAVGVLITSIGVSYTGATRYTFGLVALYDGISFIAVLIGLFAITEMIKLAEESGSISEDGVEMTGNKYIGFSEVKKHPLLVLKSSLIGLGIGSIPGSGASVSNFVAYSEAVRSHPAVEFGKGAIEGVLAPEASNNATVAGALIPTLSFGIPGSGATAVLLGGLLMHGIRPGPDLFGPQLHLTYTLFLTLLIGSLMILSLGLLLITRLKILTKIDTDYIIPIIVVLSTLGALTLRNNWVDIITVLVMGVLGYYLVKNEYSIIALVLGAVLGQTVERNFLRSLQVVDGGPLMIFFSSIIAIVLTAMIVFTLLSSNSTHLKRLLKRAIAGIRSSDSESS
ncbi:tripartite tricarboxylate transporter permease [Haloferax sp. AB510]|uniref:tripartite tricarboxylate transporter permease n=1 Tax=Haloferax sp. AB510 TaxID=2934172 RepID=UPI00209C0E03|nr:tripartite tricarboxylate transporter permease [Haloferax sp. AB510]MCO8268422.1 tripartite tricarboxylate transporter permease [Haloferax sp. AB510]